MIIDRCFHRPWSKFVRPCLFNQRWFIHCFRLGSFWKGRCWARLLLHLHNRHRSGFIQLWSNVNGHITYDNLIDSNRPRIDFQERVYRWCHSYVFLYFRSWFLLQTFSSRVLHCVIISNILFLRCRVLLVSIKRRRGMFYSLTRRRRWGRIHRLVILFWCSSKCGISRRWLGRWRWASVIAIRRGRFGGCWGSGFVGCPLRWFG